MPDLDLTVDLLVIGAFTGCGFALLALGLVLVYRVQGVINFAHGAVGSLAAYVMLFVAERTTPLLGLAAAVVFASVLSGLIEVLFVERTSGPVEAAIVMLGLTIAFEALAALIWGTAPRLLPAVSMDGIVSLLGITTSWDTVLLAIVTVTAAVGLHVFLQRTRAGLRIEAVAQSPLGATLSGISQRRAAVTSWMVAGGLAGLAGVLLARQQQLDPSSLSIFTVLALVPAFVGGLRSIGLTVAGGIALGAVSSYLTGFSSQAVISARNLLPVIVVLLVLLLRSREMAQGARRRQV